MTRKDSVSMVIPQLCNVSLFCSQMQIYVAIFKLKKKKTTKPANLTATGSKTI